MRGPTAEGVMRELGVSNNTIYAWKAKYGAMDVSEAGKVKRLRDENVRLRKLVADLSLGKDILNSKIRRISLGFHPSDEELSLGAPALRMATGSAALAG